jgi:CRISPR-associated protein Cas1
MDRIVDISTDQQHLSIHRGFLLIERERQEVGRVSLDDIAAVLVHAHGITYSNAVLVELAKRNAPLIACGANHFPVAWTLPVEGHHEQGARLRAQWQAPLPLCKRLWRDIVRAKVTAQADLLLARGDRAGEGLWAMVARVRSGDPDNLEAQAARRYWPQLFGTDFRRDRDAAGINALLNYGYTVLRAATARAVLGAGLHPTIGLAHANRGNAFSLVDDLMEPFRPIVDWVVLDLVAETTKQRSDADLTLTPVAKQALAAIIGLDLRFPDCRSPLSIALNRLTLSLARAFESNQGRLDIARPDFGPQQFDLLDDESDA